MAPTDNCFFCMKVYYRERERERRGADIFRIRDLEIKVQLGRVQGCRKE